MSGYAGTKRASFGAGWDGDHLLLTESLPVPEKLFYALLNLGWGRGSPEGVDVDGTGWIQRRVRFRVPATTQPR